MTQPSTFTAFMHAMQLPAAKTQADWSSETMQLLSGNGDLPTVFPVTELASASVATAALALARHMKQLFGRQPAVSIDRRLASFWFATSIKPEGWALPAVRDSITGDYATKDGWIRLHANAPHHRAAALAVLDTATAPDKLAQAIKSWTATALEDAIVTAGGCAAAMRTCAAWADHPQGRALQAEPIFRHSEGNTSRVAHAAARPERPLAGIRVLDLTRVLAGPVSTRFLAGFGAEVLRIDPPFWTEPGMVPEVTLGKRCAQLDLRINAQLEQLKHLLADADVIVHGYRADALTRMGLDAQARQNIRPGLVDVCLNAYGWTGPWHTRRGFDSLVQMSCGIADTGMKHFGTGHPVPLPVQALDQATGYLMAAAVLQGLTTRLQHGRGSQTQLSLARTAHLLMTQEADASTSFAPKHTDDYSPAHEETSWGPAYRLKPPCTVENTPMLWDFPACALRSSPAQWL